jgi:gas vesicle protein
MNKQVLKGFAVGALIIGATGYIIGIMTAPASGRDTRSKLYKVKKRSAKKAAKELQAIHNQLDDVVDEVDVQKAVKAIKGLIKNLK